MTPHDKPSLQTLTGAPHLDEYLTLDIGALLDAYGLVPFLTLLGRVIAEKPLRFPPGTDRRIVDAAVLLANTIG